MTDAPYITADEGSVLIRIKVVPGGSRDQIAGTLGDALKIKVSAPPEGGKANAAVCALLARALGVAKRDVVVIAGHTQPHKQIRVAGISANAAAATLAAN
jgi:uncharacterized protein (TIGR00251 family)